MTWHGSVHWVICEAREVIQDDKLGWKRKKKKISQESSPGRYGGLTRALRGGWFEPEEGEVFPLG